MPKPSPADDLARECVNMYAELRRASNVLHDEIGSLLVVVGLRLQMLCMDFPEARARISEVAEAMEQAMEHVRKLSRDLEPSPVRRTGLKNALLDLAAGRKGVSVRYSATALMPPLAADALYRAIASAVGASLPAAGVKRIAVAVSGARSVTARVVHRGPVGTAAAGELAAAALLGRYAGLRFEIKTKFDKTRQIKARSIKSRQINDKTKTIERLKSKQCTIIVIHYAGKRPFSGRS